MARRSLLFNSVVYVVGQFASKALAFVLLIVYARFLEPSDFGITGTLSAYGAVLGTIFVLGLHGAATRHYFDLKDDRAALKSYLSSVYAFQLAFSAACIIVTEIWGGWLWQRFTSGLIDFSYVRVALWSTFLMQMTQIPQALYQAEERAAALVGWQTAQGAFALLVGVLFVAVLEERALGVLRSQAIASGALAVVLLVLFVRNWGTRDLRWEHVRKGLSYGLPLLPHTLGSILMQSVDRIMLEKYASQADVGLYSIAMLLGSLLAMIAGGVNQAWAPHFFRTSSEEPPEQARHKAELFASVFVAIFTIMGLVGALLGNELLYVLGEKYLPVLPYLIPFVIGNLIGIYYFLPANQLLYKSGTGWFVVATGLATAISVGLNIWILPRGGGGMAAAWIFVIGSLVQTGVVFLAARRHQRSLMSVRHGIVIAIALAALGVATNSPPLALRVTMLVAASTVTYFLLVRGKLGEVLPQRP